MQGTLELTADDVSELVTEALRSRGYTVQEVTLKAAQRYDQLDRLNGICCTGARVKVSNLLGKLDEPNRRSTTTTR